MDRILKGRTLLHFSSIWRSVSINDPMDRILKVARTAIWRDALAVSINDPMDRILKDKSSEHFVRIRPPVSINDPMDRILKAPISAPVPMWVSCFNQRSDG